MRLIIITIILFPITCSFLWSRLTAVASLVDALADLCALRARRMSEIPSPASSSSDGDEALTYEEILEEASMDAHSAANTCSCGEHSSMMTVFGFIESGRGVWSTPRLESWRPSTLASVTRPSSFCGTPSEW